MPSWSGVGDLTTNNLPNLGGSGIQGFRPSNAVNTYTPGICLELAAIDSQFCPTSKRFIPLAAGTTTCNFVGVVADSWLGFDNARNSQHLVRFAHHATQRARHAVHPGQGQRH